MPVISANQITKLYPERQGPRVLFGRGGLPDWFRARADGFAALKGVSLQVNAGESLGIIGSNGSGKSTLLKILAGVTLPTTGDVTVEGRVASLLELGAGFHPMLTGRENIYLNAAIYGLHRAEVDALFESIVDFSGIRDFIDRPVDTYSSGMYVRIAFSVAIHMNPDVFLVDEVLAVGDEDFQRKCRRKIGELREQGKTIVFVSHDLGIVNTVCDRVVLLNKGELLERGTPQQTFDYYLRQVGQAAGIHRLAWGENEALFSNGKLSLFSGGQETTAPEGIHASIESMGQHHASVYADWRVVKSDDTSFVAEGMMPRVPCRLRFEYSTNSNALTMGMTIEATHAFSLESLSLVIPVPASMDRWLIDQNLLRLEPLTPAHVNAEAATMPQTDVTTIMAFSESPAVETSLFIGSGITYFAGDKSENTYWHLVNGDYLSSVRRLFHTLRPAPADRDMQPGEKVILTNVFIGAGHSGANYRKAAAHLHEQQECVAAGLRASMNQGRLLLESEAGQPLGEIQALFSVENLWSNSTSLKSTTTRPENDVVYMVSHSNRLPLNLRWELRPREHGVELSLLLRVREAVKLQEYNLSWLLPADYSNWAFEHERGNYTHFEEAQEWRPLNRGYQQSTFIEIQAEGRPTLHWSTTTPGALPSVLNTGAGQHKRVAQWLRRPDGADAFYFEPGTHPLLSVVIQLADE
jgi:ABC-type polysaccharide/polyol phosphate transport system ATPase subunit